MVLRQLSILMRYSFWMRVKLTLCKYFGHKPDLNSDKYLTGVLWCKRCDMNTHAKIGRLW